MWDEPCRNPYHAWSTRAIEYWADKVTPPSRFTPDLIMDELEARDQNPFHSRYDGVEG